MAFVVTKNGTVDQHTNVFSAYGRLEVISQDAKNNCTKFKLQLWHGTTGTSWTWKGLVYQNWINVNNIIHYPVDRTQNNNPWTNNPCLLYEDEYTVQHDPDGKLDLDIQMYAYAPSGSWGPGNVYVPSNNSKWRVTLPQIDRSAPTVTCSVSSVSTNAVTVAYSVNQDFDIVEYSLNNGAWTAVTINTNRNFTISNLAANTTYSIKVRARRTSNNVYGTSANLSAQTHPTPVTVKTLVATATDPHTITVTATTNTTANTDRIEIKCSNASNTQWQTITGGSGTVSFTVDPDKTYTITAYAYTKRSGAMNSSTQTCTTPADTYCSIINANGSVTGKKKLFLINTNGVVTEIKKDKIHIL